MLSISRVVKCLVIAAAFASLLAGCNRPMPETSPETGRAALQQAREKAIKQGKVPPP